MRPAAGGYGRRAAGGDCESAGGSMARKTGSVVEPRFDKALRLPGVRLHLYEKLRPRKGRKMGHLSAVGRTAEEAVERVLRAQALLL